MNNLDTTMSQPKSPTSGVPCCIYVRKSNEEGLEQDFNSLHAQYESCRAYILSQAHEGWHFVEKYEDPALSGGTLNRPALQQMLSDIKLGKIKCVVVYKIDRLSRSLFDFAKLNEVFEEYGVSFVSITQSFNTANAMGKLMLNVLLSFAQFEREVTGERIRDKILASKQKGIWLRDDAPLGYKSENRKLVVDEKDAKIINYIFNKYLEYKSLTLLMNHLNEVGIKRRSWTSKRTGQTYGGSDFSHDSLKNLLSDVIYLGKISHKEQVYDGLQEAIISKDLFDEVQSMLKERAHVRVKKVSKSTALLSGKLFDIQGILFKSDHTQKATNGQRKIYKYYLGENVRLTSSEIDNIALNMLKNLFVRLDELENKELSFRLKSLSEPLKYAKGMISKAIYEEHQFSLILSRENLEKLQEHYIEGFKALDLKDMKITLDEQNIYLIQPLKLEAKYGTTSIKTLKAKHPKLDRLIKGYGYRKQLEAGMSIKEIAQLNNIDLSYTRKLIKLAYSHVNELEEILGL